jgi:hypothetical protein
MLTKQEQNAACGKRQAGGAVASSQKHIHMLIYILYSNSSFMHTFDIAAACGQRHAGGAEADSQKHVYISVYYFNMKHIYECISVYEIEAALELCLCASCLQCIPIRLEHVHAFAMYRDGESQMKTVMAGKQ